MGTRQADLTLIPHAQPYEFSHKIAMPFPVAFIKYMMVAWRQNKEMLGAMGMLRLFDTPRWFVIVGYVVLQIALRGFILGRRYCGAFLSVFAYLLRQCPYERKGAIALQMSAFSFCLV